LFEATQQDNRLESSEDAQGDRRLDGARAGRTQESFRLQVIPGGTLLARLGSSEPTQVEVRVQGQRVGALKLGYNAWQELSLRLPNDTPQGVAQVELVAAGGGGSFASLHYWSFSK
jgi:hypothetical protein